MDKNKADKLILQYRDRIYGFSLSRMRSISYAEELAADIICEVYLSFLNADYIANPDGYVYRIASNVYARHIRDLTRSRNTLGIDGMELPFYDSYAYETNAEELKALRKEIAWLSERQRTILYLHYYEKMTAAQIAAQLGISHNTVKWHLSDARSTLKERMIMEEKKTDLTVNPIRFTDMGHNGFAGTTGDTADMFDTRLKQNIAWLCYWQPRTLEEIARELNVPSVYVTDELQKLVAYAYLDRLDNSKNPKYRTNMYLKDARRRFSDRGNTFTGLYQEAAKKLSTEYFRVLFDAFDADAAHWGFCCAGEDTNFMKYSLLMAVVPTLGHTDLTKEYDRLMVKRPDGGRFIAHATVGDDCRKESGDFSPYWVCGLMTRGDDTFCSIQLDCGYADRHGRWRDNRSEDWISLVRSIKSGYNPEAIALEEYKRLCDKGYLWENQVQVVTLPLPVFDQTFDLQAYLKPYLAPFEPIREGLVDYHKEMDEKFYRLEAPGYPEHIQPLIRLYNTNVLGDCQFVPYLLEEMLAQGILKPLNDVQKKAALSILCY